MDDREIPHKLAAGKDRHFFKTNGIMLLGFKPRFEEPIQVGTKVFTMRVERKVKPKIGERLYMYTGLRTKNCRKISDKEKLISTQRVRIRITMMPNRMKVLIDIDGRRLQIMELHRFVKFDGFKSIPDFVEYWVASSIGKKPNSKKTYRVGGFLTLYHWTDLRF